MTEKTHEETLTAEQTAVLQLVTIESSPRSADELAKNYDGLRAANLWPEQSEKQVKERVAELVKAGKLKKGEKTPDGEPVIELTAKA
jgi:hypothetical protein